MKKTMRFLVTVCALTTSLTSFAACGGGGGNGNSTETMVEKSVEAVLETLTPWDSALSGTVNVRIEYAGYGQAFVDNVAAGFMKRYPGVKVDVDPTVEKQAIYAEACGGINTKYDLYILDATMRGNQDVLVDLSDVYAAVNPEETVSVGEKMNPTHASVYDGNKNTKFGIPALTGSYGVVYNTEVLDDYVNKFPVTSDGWTALCDAIKQDYGTTMYALLLSGDKGVNYWHPVADTFVAQYLGLEAYNYMQVGRNAQGGLDATVSYDISQLYAAQAIEDLLWYENGYVDPLSVGYQYLQAQDEFMAFGSSAMMVNGSWMMTESDTVLDSVNFDFAMAKIPVLSDIIKHPNCKDTIANDAELTALINAIDNGSTALTGEGYDVDQKAFDHVKNARSYTYASGEGCGAFVPKQIGANRIALAKKFLTYMYSEEGILLYSLACNGAILPVKQGYQPKLSDMPEFNPKMATFLETAYEISFNNTLIFRKNGVAAVNSFVFSETYGCYEVMYCSPAASDRCRAQKAYDDKVSLWSANDHAKWKMEMQAKGFAIVEHNTD